MKSQSINQASAGMFFLSFLMLLFIVPLSGICAIDTAKNDAALKAVVTQVVTQLQKSEATSKQSKVLDYSFDEIAPTGKTEEHRNDTIMAGYEVSLKISYPKDFLLQRPTDKTPLILYADGFPLAGMTTDYFTQLRKANVTDPDTWLPPNSMWIHFIFKRDSTTKEAWNTLFRLAQWNDEKIKINLSLGWSGMFPLENNTKKGIEEGNVTVVFYNFWVFLLLLLGYLTLIVFFVYLCYSTGLIRDPDVVKDDNSIIKGPFSLSQTQLAFWTILIIGGFIYLTLLTGLADSVNNSILLLLGISGGTTGAASLIDYYKKNPNNQNAQPLIPKKHRGFLLDILSDGVNVSMQRAQTILWNLVLGGYFLWYVITNKSMPVFNNTLLVLAGVSSVLYLGSKGPENRADPATKPVGNTD